MRKIILLLGIWGVMVGAFAQIGTLDIAPASFHMYSSSGMQVVSDSVTVLQGDSLSFSARLEYTGATALTDELGFIIARDTGGTIVHQDSSFTGITETLNSGDTTRVNISDIVDSMAARYSGGGGGAILVIIWPVARSTPTITTDSVRAKIFFDNLASLPPEWEDKLQFICFPNPVSTELFIRYKGIQNDIEYVRIYDLNGQEIIHKKGAATSIDLTSVKAGFYFMHIQGKDTEAVVKLEKK